MAAVIFLLLFSRKRRFSRSLGCTRLDMDGMWKKMRHSLETGPSIQVSKCPALFLEADAVVGVLTCLLFLRLRCKLPNKIVRYLKCAM